MCKQNLFTPFLLGICKYLVNHPDELVIKEVIIAGNYAYEINTHPADAGQIIGKSGKNIKAIRHLLESAASMQGKRASVDIPDNRGNSTSKLFILLGLAISLLQFLPLLFK